MKNRIISLMLAVLLVNLVPVNVSFAQSAQICGEWDDVSAETEDYFKMIEVCELNWIRGGNGKLNLNQKLKRVELVAIVNRVLELDTASNDPNFAYAFLADEFNDMSEYDSSKDWMYKTMYIGVQQVANFNQKFWNGYQDGSFRMLNDISFAEFSKLILFSFEKNDKLNGNFRLNEFSGDEWFSAYFNFLESKGVLSLDGETFDFEGETFSVHDSMTRYDAIKLIYKMLERDIYIGGVDSYLDNASFVIPYYLDEVDSENEEVKIWRDNQGDSNIEVVKILRSSDVVMPLEFVSVYVRTRISSDVDKMYRIDKCSDAGTCVRAYWLVLKDNNVLLIEGRFIKEKTALGSRAVDSIVDSLEFK